MGRSQEKVYHICAVNLLVLGVCIGFAVLYPSIGTIIRFSGAICGFVIVFLLPCLVLIASRRKSGNLSVTLVAVNVAVILVGFANVVAQFLFF